MGVSGAVAGFGVGFGAHCFDDGSDFIEVVGDLVVFVTEDVGDDIGAIEGEFGETPGYDESEILIGDKFLDL